MQQKRGDHAQSLQRWEGDKGSHKRVFALLTPEKPQLEMARMLYFGDV